MSKCEICGRAKPAPPIDFHVKRNLLHDLCWRCNKGLDAVDYDAERLKMIADYIRRYSSDK